MWAFSLPHVPARLSVAGISSGNQGIVIQYANNERTVEIYSAQSRKLLKEFSGIEETFVEDFSSSGADQVLLKPTDPSKGFQFTNMNPDSNRDDNEQTNVSVVVDLLYARYLTAQLALESSEEMMRYKVELLERSLVLLSSYSDGQEPLYRRLPENGRGTAGEELILIDSLSQQEDKEEEREELPREQFGADRWPVRVLQFCKSEYEGRTTLLLKLLNNSLSEEAHCLSVSLLLSGGVFGERAGPREADVVTTSPSPFVIPPGKSVVICLSVAAELSPLLREVPLAAMGEVVMLPMDSAVPATTVAATLQCWGLLRLKRYAPSRKDVCIDSLAQCTAFPVEVELLFLTTVGSLLGFAQTLEDELHMQTVGTKDTRILLVGKSPLLRISLQQGRHEVACTVSAASEHDLYMLLATLADWLPSDVRVLLDPTGKSAAKACARASSALLEEQRLLGRWLDDSIRHKPPRDAKKELVMCNLVDTWKQRTAFLQARLDADTAVLELRPWLYCPECDHWKEVAQQ